MTIEKDKKRKSISGKILFMVIGMVLIITVLIGSFSVTRHRQEVIALKVEQSIMVGKIVAEYAAGDLLKELADSDSATSYYFAIESLLSEVKTATNVKSLYAVVPLKEEQKIRYIAEGKTPDDNSEDIYDYNSLVDYDSFFGSAEKSDAFLAAFENGETYDNGMYQDPDSGYLMTMLVPVLDSSGKTAAMIGIDMNADDIVNDANRLMYLLIAIAVAGIVVLFVVSRVLIKKTIVQPLKNMVLIADSLASGDVNVNVEKESDDEIGQLAHSFQKMVENIREQANAAERISEGDFSIEITPKSDKDILSSSLLNVKQEIGSLSAETAVLITAALTGKLSARGNAEQFSGGYKEIIKGFNAVLDAIAAPVNEASKVLQEIAKGNLHVKMEGEYRGDHAGIKNALNETIDNLQSYISEISRVLSEIGDGNLDQHITAEYKGDFIAIKDSLNNISISLSDALGEINQAAEEVASAAKQVSNASQVLSQGSTQQASTIQQLSASIAEIANQTKQNAKSANQASMLSGTAKENGIKGNDQMQGMLSSMQDINQSAFNISKIIKVIDDIAFQTNILALNAAVEAARAGQHGKGFAVVAEEVRNLAARSATAAKETTDLIEGSIQKVETGTKLASATAKALNEISSGIEESANLVNSIAHASNQQASGIDQINAGIEQISVAVSGNLATAEESAAASEEMSSQAEILKQMVGRFQLKKTVDDSDSWTEETIIHLDEEKMDKY